MRYLSLSEIVDLHRLVIAQSGGAEGIRDLNAADSAVTQPAMTFDGQDLYATLAEKAAALGFFLIRNHPFTDGNKRVGHAAMETFLVLNEYELDAPVEEQEQVILQVAAGRLARPEFTEWVRARLVSTRKV